MLELRLGLDNKLKNNAKLFKSPQLEPVIRVNDSYVSCHIAIWSYFSLHECGHMLQACVVAHLDGENLYSNYNIN